MELLENTTDKRRLFGRWFARRITTYVAVCAFLTFVNWYTSPHYWWVVWVMAGWGLNLILSIPPETSEKVTVQSDFDRHR